MSQNNFFCTYNTDTTELNSGTICNIPNYCKKCLNEKSKKCKKYYKRIDKNTDGIHECPYGFTTIVKNNTIYTSIVTSDEIPRNLKQNLTKDDYHQITKLSKKAALTIIENEITNENDLNKYKEAIHDLRNMAANFNSMVDDYIYDKEQKGEELRDVEYSLISLYELINFRLDILYEKVEFLEYTDKTQKVHPMIKKVKHILYYNAKKKNIDINLSNKQENKVKLTKSLYLAAFILLENAIKYSEPNSRIDINFKETATQIDIIISNQTTKMIEKDGNILKKRGIRGSNQSGRVGSGIGLSLANELLSKDGINLNIEIKNTEKKTSKFIARITMKTI